MNSNASLTAAVLDSYPEMLSRKDVAKILGVCYHNAIKEMVKVGLLPINKEFKPYEHIKISKVAMTRYLSK